jgi:creatinine amidohydrolase
MPQSVMWQALTAAQLNEEARADAVVLLPVASMEQHGPHLPVGVDSILCEGVCRRAAEAVSPATPVVVAPTLWCGMAEHHMAFGGTFSFDLPTYRAVLICLSKSIERHGFKRLLIVNGHGGNIAALSAFLPDLAAGSGLKIRTVTYFELAQPAISAILEDQDGVRHACEAETSLMLVLAPETVRLEALEEAHGPAHVHRRPLALGQYRSFRDFTRSGVVGDARRASRAKGEKLLAACCAALLATLEDPQTWKLSADG